MKRLTIDIPESLHTRVKVQCAAHGTTITEAVREFLETTFPVPVKENVSLRLRADLMAAYRYWAMDERCQLGELIEQAMEHYLSRSEAA